jgi:Tfp pilus assembly protein PilF
MFGISTVFGFLAMTAKKNIIKTYCTVLSVSAVSALLVISPAGASSLTTNPDQSTGSDFRAQVLVVDAYKRMQKGDYSSAVQILQKALRLDSTNTEAHRYLAFSFLHTGLVSLALQESKQVLESGTDLPQDHFAMGEAQFYTGKPELALKSYQGALQMNPLFTQARIGVVRCLIAMGKVRQAKDICLKAAYNSPCYQSKIQFKKLLNEMDSRMQAIGSPVAGS